MPWVGELIQIKEDNKNKAYKSMPGRVVGEVMNEMRNECVLPSQSITIRSPSVHASLTTRTPVITW